LLLSAPDILGQDRYGSVWKSYKCGLPAPANFQIAKLHEVLERESIAKNILEKVIFSLFVLFLQNKSFCFKQLEKNGRSEVWFYFPRNISYSESKNQEILLILNVKFYWQNLHKNN
jgi:hypothetical protein